MEKYDFIKIEKKWQDHWQKQYTFKTGKDLAKPKFYCLDMFPYPSAAGLHVGHIEGYTASDIIARFKRLQGYDVLHPFGWDAFGLPAEQYALQTGNNPQHFTKTNIKTFKHQIQRLGKSVDWDKELSTTDPHYYKWTQWIFTQLFNDGLASLKDVEVNWCEELGTVLANDEIVNENGIMYSERGHHLVVKKPMRQWVLHITEYAEELLTGLDDLAWPENLKEMQRNWIGKSLGAIIKFPIENSDELIEVFTTRPDTIFGVTHLCISPESELINLVDEIHQVAVKDYVSASKAKSDLERQIGKDKTGVLTGLFAIHPITNVHLPIWVADYVLPNYGTGAVMAVPGHDLRDYEFATKYDICYLKVIESNEPCYEGDGIHINSDFLDGLNNEQAISSIIEYLTNHQLGYAKVTYKLRDWVFSRQRYWGEPFPVLFDKHNNVTVLKLDQLPLELPYLTDIKPSGTGESPLALDKKWLHVEIDGKEYRRDTNTMPQLAGSAWYYIGYILKNHLGIVPLNSPDAKPLLDRYLPVDLYIGGTEHAVGHLLYSRFWHKFLYKKGLVSTQEPFLKLVNQGMILGPDHKKMSKSLGNTVSPNEIFADFGADALRVYEMFMGPIEAEKPWSNHGLEAAKRFLDRVFRLNALVVEEDNQELEVVLHETIKKVTHDFEGLAFNTAIAQMMTLVNAVNKAEKIGEKQFQTFLLLLNPIAPHLTEELNQRVVKSTKELSEMAWPSYDESILVKASQKLMIQVNGKIKGQIEVPLNSTETEVFAILDDDQKYQKIVENKVVMRRIYVKEKLISVVLK